MKPQALIAAALAASLGACGTADKIKNIGQQPALTEIRNPVAQPGYKPVQMPMPQPEPAQHNANSLWQNGARAFFKDQRARKIGDILTIDVLITDKAEIDNETRRSRTGSEALGARGTIGDAAVTILPAGSIKTELIGIDSNGSHEGTGSVNRSEKLTTKVAAVVTQVLPNGNMVIEGRQEIRVNYEVRELIVAGVIRPEDIDAENTIDSTKIAEARISYGGRGQITEVQQPRYGQQFLDIVLPF